jgi:hypothetical protein
VRDENLGIVPGQRYRASGSLTGVWEVVTVLRHPGEPVPHAQLARVGAPKDLKTVALRVLRDRRFYQPIQS